MRTTNPKYELVIGDHIDVKINGCTRTLFRIKLLRGILNGATRKYYTPGTLGGYIESEENLSHRGGCWVEEDSFVCEDAIVTGESLVHGTSTISGSSIVQGKSIVFSSKVAGYSFLIFNAKVESSNISSVLVGPGVELFNQEQLHDYYKLGNIGYSIISPEDKVIDILKKMTDSEKNKLIREIMNEDLL